MKYKVVRDTTRSHVALVAVSTTGFVIRKYEKHNNWESNYKDAKEWVDSLVD